MTKTVSMLWIAVAICLGASGNATAQAAKKYVTPDGKVVYSDTPIEGAKEVGEIKPPPQIDPSSRSRADEAARRDAEKVKALDQRLEARAAQDAAQRARVEAAEARLEEAQRTLKDGKEPLPGERRGTAGGQSRLTEAYLKRQETNRKAVEDAQKALAAARRAK